MSRVVSVNVGLPREVDWRGRKIRTAIFKQPVTGRVLAQRLNLAGDGQADLAGHGGEQRALLVYQLDSYRFWEKYLRREDFVYGQFGENLTVEGLQILVRGTAAGLGTGDERGKCRIDSRGPAACMAWIQTSHGGRLHPGE